MWGLFSNESDLMEGLFDLLDDDKASRTITEDDLKYRKELGKPRCGELLERVLSLPESLRDMAV